MWYYDDKFEERQRFLGTPPPFEKGLLAIIDFLSLPPSWRSHSYKEKMPEISSIGDFMTYLVTKSPNMVFHDQLLTLKYRDFESIVGQLLSKLGGNVIQGKRGADGTIDLLWNTPGGNYIIQCKKWKSKVGEKIIREVYGAAMKFNANGAFIVTTSEFSANAVNFAEDLSPKLGLIDGKELFNLMSLLIPTVVEDITEGRWKS